MIGQIRREDISGVRLEVTQVGRPFMRFAVFIQIEGKDFYKLDTEPTVQEVGDDIKIEFPEVVLEIR